MKPLERAAAASSQGQLYMRLAQVQIDREQWGPARDSLRKALAKGGLPDRGAAHFLLGIAAVSDAQWEDAREAFESAAEFEERQQASEEWIAHIEQEQEAEALEAAEAEAARSVEEQAAGDVTDVSDEPASDGAPEEPVAKAS